MVSSSAGRSSWNGAEEATPVAVYGWHTLDESCTVAMPSQRNTLAKPSLFRLSFRLRVDQTMSQQRAKCIPSARRVVLDMRVVKFLLAVKVVDRSKR
jgi:hypothetical protein